jgi:hypothetical protein
MKMISFEVVAIATSSRAGEDRNFNSETFGYCLRHHLLLRNGTERFLKNPYGTPYDSTGASALLVSDL